MPAATLEKPETKKPAPVAPPAPAPTVGQWQCPRVSVGDMVLWYCDGDVGATPSTARVTTVTPGTVDLIVDTKDASIRRYGVHHIHDPAIKNFPDIRKQGAWGVSSLMQRLAILEKRMDELENLATG